MSNEIISAEQIATSIRIIRGQKVLLHEKLPRYRTRTTRR